MRISPVPKMRPAFTLLEMILAATVAVLLLAALYVAMDLQLRHAEAAREVVTETRLARTLLYRIAEDIAPDVATADPSRYQQSGQSGSGGASGGSSGGASGGSSGGASGGSSGGASGGSNTSGSNSSSQANSTNNTGSGSSNATTSGNTTTSTFASTTGTTAVSSPNGLAVLALQGTSNSLTLYVSRVPTNPPGSDDSTQVPGLSDQHRIVYWLVDGGGLARQDVTATTSDDAANGNVPSGMPDPGSKQLLAKEVQSLQFQYFDGSDWQDSWDGTQVGADGVTPIGPPVAVAITIGIASPGGGDVKTYRHVVAIPTANSPTTVQQSSSGGSTSP